MLAFAKDITQDQPGHPDEKDNSELKQYMDYQRKLDHGLLVHHALDQAKNELNENIEAAAGDTEKLQAYLQQKFPLSHRFADADTLILMLRKLVNAHNSTNNWYRMNAFYYALVYDCMQRFVEMYNRLLRESPEKAAEFRVAEGVEIDFDDWTYLYFPDLDFHMDKDLGNTHYPFAKRNLAIQEDLRSEMQNGKSREEALQAVKGQFEIDDTAIKVLLDKKITPKDLELFYTSVENPIYEYLTPVQEGSWGSIDGESILDHAYYMGSHLKVWEWRKREEVESVMDEIEKTQKK